MLPCHNVIDAYIIVYCEYARETVCCLVHAHLKDVLGHIQTKCLMPEPVSATVGIKCGQIGRILIEVDAPETVLSLQLTETCSTT